MSLNTTGHLIRDMEQLRQHLGVDAWLLSGGSWGVTLSLAYAERFPERVSGLLLFGVTTTRRSEVDWLYRGAGRIFPEAWERFRDFAGAGDYPLPTDTEPPIEGLLLAYSRLMENPDPGVRMRAAAEWVAWEDAVISAESNGSPGLFSDRQGDARLAFVRICSHYFAHGAFLDDGVLIREAGRLAGIPGILIQGATTSTARSSPPGNSPGPGPAPSSWWSRTPGTPAAQPWKTRSMPPPTACSPRSAPAMPIPEPPRPSPEPAGEE
jgi:proline iminopeptidase